MADPRTDAFSTAASDTPAAQADARTALFASAAQAPESPSAPSWGEHIDKVIDTVKNHPFSLALGMGENALGAVGGMAGSVADAVTFSEPGTHDWAYRPRTEAGKEIAQEAGEESANLGRLYDKAPGGDTPLGQTIRRYGPEALNAVGAVSTLGGVAKGLTPAARPPQPRLEPGIGGPGPQGTATPGPQAGLNAAYANSPQSMGAAAAAPQLSQMSPGTQQAFRTMTARTGGAVNPTAATNIADADINGVQLMRGQATRDPIQFSEEQNSTHPDIVKRRNEQETRLVDRLDEIRAEASPGHVQNHAIDNGQIAVDALKAYDEPIKADVSARYKKLVDANGGTVPIDTNQFLHGVDSELKKQYLTNSVPPQAQALLNSLRAGEPLDFQGFEAARTRLAEAQRAGGSEAVAAGIIRNRLEQIPLSPAAAHLKTLADDARGAAKARFDALEKDPAYKAAVSDSVPKGEPSPLADRFLDKYVLGTAPRANVDSLLKKLDPDAREAVTAHVLSAVRGKAVGSTGKISPGQFNSALEKYGPKLDQVAPDVREPLESLGRTITNVKAEPPGGFVNYSKSGVVMQHAAHVGEMALNAKTGGIASPVIKVLTRDRFAKRALEPGAGLDELPTK